MEEKTKKASEWLEQKRKITLELTEHEILDIEVLLLRGLHTIANEVTSPPGSIIEDYYLKNVIRFSKTQSKVKALLQDPRTFLGNSIEEERAFNHKMNMQQILWVLKNKLRRTGQKFRFNFKDGDLDG